MHRQSVGVEHGYFALLMPDTDPSWDLEAAFAGSENGLIGVGVLGQISVRTRTLFGFVRLSAFLHDEPPALRDAPDIVEASLHLIGDLRVIDGFGDQVATYGIAPGDYILRASFGGGEPEEVLLDLWPQTGLTAGRVLRSSTGHGGRWHGETGDPVLLNQPADEQEPEAEGLIESSQFYSNGLCGLYFPLSQVLAAFQDADLWSTEGRTGSLHGRPGLKRGESLEVEDTRVTEHSIALSLQRRVGSQQSRVTVEFALEEYGVARTRVETRVGADSQATADRIAVFVDERVGIAGDRLSADPD